MTHDIVLPSNEQDVLRRHFPQGVIAIDLETTGLSPLIDKIIEISAIKITATQVSVFERLINPQIAIPAYTTDIHGITDEMVQHKETINNELPEFFDFIENLPIIAHNAKFDLGFIIFQAHQLEIAMGNNKVFCSVHQARHTFENSESYKLKELARQLSIELVNHHRATDDALASLRIFAQCLLKNEKTKTKYLYDLEQYSQTSCVDLPTHLGPLYQNLPSQKEMLIKYKGGSIKNRWRAIKPVSVLPMPQGSILYAKCLHSDLYKSFSLKKIAEVMDSEIDEIKRIIANEIANK